MKSKESRSVCFSYNTKIFCLAFVVALITIVVYLPALQNNFVNFDDPLYVSENPHIQSMGFKSLKWMFTTFHASNWHPLTWLSHAIDYALWGLNPMGHHLTSIIFHALNTFLVVILIINLMQCAQCEVPFSIEREEYSRINSISAGVITGLLFGLHPIHVESVAWISERKDVLYAFFFLISILYYMRYCFSLQKRKILNYSLSLLFFILALMSKPMAVTLPVVLLILDFYPLKRVNRNSSFISWRNILLEKIPFFFLSIGSSAVTIIAQKKGGAVMPIEVSLFSDRILVALQGLIFYLFKIFWPIKLAPFYPYPSDVSLISGAYMGSVFLVLCVTLFCILYWGKRGIFLTLWVYYVATLLPVLGFIKIGGQATADRYAYLPSLGPFLLFGMGIIWLQGRINFKCQRKIFKNLPVILFSILIIGLFSYITVKQEAIWKDSVTLWTIEVKQFPYLYRGYNNRAEAYIKMTEYQHAISDLNRAIKLEPKESVGYYNRGIAYGNLGKYSEAIRDFKKAIMLSPQNALYYLNLAIAYKRSGDYQSALKLFTAAVELDPFLQKAYFDRGDTYMYLGLYKEAIKDFQSAARQGNKQAQEYLRAKGISWGTKQLQ